MSRPFCARQLLMQRPSAAGLRKVGITILNSIAVPLRLEMTCSEVAKTLGRLPFLGTLYLANSIDQICQRPGLSILSTSSLTSATFFQMRIFPSANFTKINTWENLSVVPRRYAVGWKLARQRASYSAAICCTVLSTASSTTAGDRSSSNLGCRSRYSFQA